MAIETLLQAALFIEQQATINRNATTCWSSDNPLAQLAVVPNSRQSSHEPREHSHEMNKKNGNSIFRKSRGISRASVIHHTETQQNHQNHHHGGIGSRIFDVDQTQNTAKNKNRSLKAHKESEKNRRDDTKKLFEILRQQIPEQEKLSQRLILIYAKNYIQNLNKKNREYEHEKIRLIRERLSLQQQLTNLKKELSSKRKQVDFNDQIPELKPVIKTFTEKSEKYFANSSSLAKFDYPANFQEDACAFCTIKVDLNERKAHLIQNHSAEFHCFICYKKKANERSLKEHEKRHSMKDYRNIYYCPHCQQPFDKFYLVLAHVAISHKEKVKK